MNSSRRRCVAAAPRARAGRLPTGGWRAATTSDRKRLSCGVGIRVRLRSASATASISSRSTWRPVLAEAVSTRGRSRSFWCARARSWSRSTSAATSHLLSTSAVAQPLRIASSAMRRSWAGDAVGGVADHQRDVGALGGAPRAQRRVVLDATPPPWPGGGCPAVSTRISSRPLNVDAAGRSRRGWCPPPERRSRARRRRSG